MNAKKMRDYIYLRGMLDTFQKRAIKYYLEGSTDEEKFERLKQIRELLLNQQGKATSLSGVVAGASGLTIGGEYPDCSDGEVCRGGVCQDAGLPIVVEEDLFADPVDGTKEGLNNN